MQLSLRMALHAAARVRGFGEQLIGDGDMVTLAQDSIIRSISSGVTCQFIRYNVDRFNHAISFLNRTQS